MTDVISTSATSLPAQAQVAIDTMALPGTSGLMNKNASEFENMFVTQMLQPMFEGIKVDPLFGGGHGEEIMRSFLLEEYGKALAPRLNLGIADAVKRTMLRSQENGADSRKPATLGNAYVTHR